MACACDQSGYRSLGSGTPSSYLSIQASSTYTDVLSVAAQWSLSLQWSSWFAPWNSLHHNPTSIEFTRWHQEIFYVPPLLGSPHFKSPPLDTCSKTYLLHSWSNAYTDCPDCACSAFHTTQYKNGRKPFSAGILLRAVPHKRAHKDANHTSSRQLGAAGQCSAGRRSPSCLGRLASESAQWFGR